jgi:hypothetical protein
MSKKNNNITIPIDIGDAPVGMRLLHLGQYFEACVVKGIKEWVPLSISKNKNKNNNKMGGGGGGYNETTLGPPGPEQHTWDHHHAPFYQVFNNYVCLKKDTLGELRDFFFQLFSQKDYAGAKVPFA